MLVRSTTSDGETRVLVDAGPDLREQLLAEEIDDLDGVLFSHEHADHCHGVDDLRPLFIRNRRRIDVWIDPHTAPSLHSRFSYLFTAQPGSDYPPILNEHLMCHGAPIHVSGSGGLVTATPFRLNHGNVDAHGFRFENMAYTPDVNAIPSESEDYVRDLDLWIIDALRVAPHPSHFTLSEALQWIERMKPKRAVLTNLHTDLDYQTLQRKLPANVEAAYDGMKLIF
ncbi:MBL fold metallo-hydrolase [Terrihabitans sp. B22-R8]|uniref:MBL fold metallo-hydrolase n=1 Tax=Terrihabitans sp. B22-R8 TaxID=3425128 RepID=UPI00403C2BC5